MGMCTVHDSFLWDEIASLAKEQLAGRRTVQENRKNKNVENKNTDKTENNEKRTSESRNVKM